MIVFHFFSVNANIDSLIYFCNKDSGQVSWKLLYSRYKEISFYSNEVAIKISYANKAHLLAQHYGDHVLEGSALVLLSRGYQLAGNNINALLALDKAQVKHEIVGFREGVADCLFRKAGVYQKINGFAKSEETYLVAIDELLELDSLRCAAAICNLGELYREWGKPNKALSKLQKADSLFTQLNNISSTAYTKGNIGLVYIDLNKPDSAKVNLHKAIAILEPTGDNYAVSAYLEGLARLVIADGDLEKAEQLAQRSLRLANEYGLKEQIRDASLCLSSIYSSTQNYKEAYHHHNNYVIYRDSLVNEDTIREIANLRTKYEVAQKQKEVDDLQNKKSKHQLLLVALLIILVLLGIHIFLLYKNRKQRNRDKLLLEEQRNALLKSNDTKNKFFSILSHDLRSPIATFNSYAELLNYYINTNEIEQLPKLVQELERSSSSVMHLLDNLLQWGMVQMQNIKIERQQIKVIQVFKEELHHLNSIALAKDIQIQFNIATDIELFVDKAYFAMTLRNLISNAIKFTPKGGFVCVSTYRENNSVIIKVADSGVGLDEDAFKLRLKSGEILSTYGTNNEKGLGLGMQLVCSFINSHNGSIDVESKLGKGATFILHLPMV